MALIREEEREREKSSVEAREKKRDAEREKEREAFRRCREIRGLIGMHRPPPPPSPSSSPPSLMEALFPNLERNRPLSLSTVGGGMKSA